MRQYASMISVLKYASSTVGPQLTVPWLASRIVLQSLTYGTIVFGSRWSPGVAYGAIGTSPRNTSTSGSTHFGIGSWATANAVACGGWQWTTAPTSGRFLYTARCKR